MATKKPDGSDKTVPPRDVDITFTREVTYKGVLYRAGQSAKVTAGQARILSDMQAIT